MTFRSTILTVPGLGSSGPEHWQSYWEKNFGFERINQEEWEYPICDHWTQQIDQALRKLDARNVILVGHSLGCAAIISWAEQYKINIKAALLVAPADTELDSFPPVTSGFIPMSLYRLPFPSIVACSSNDPYINLERGKELASHWGSEFINMGPLDHINSASALKNWEPGLDLLKRLDS